ncbi:MAG: mutL [Clostridia bacterium]|jgi:DNA mismatch repair protein MutL|nr:mutL [Clostridia bacterium]
MTTIKILDTHTINKIAAGEVVERPSSVVKELVENSIDAKASSITVEIKNGGIDFVRVTDNGVGIPKDEVEIAFLRHATSKINTAEDLMEVMTLGFRGEALASIASIAHIELITKVNQDITGKRIEVSGGKILSSEEIACPSGTTFIMRHIFFNVPARKEFLGSSGAEGAKISEYMYKLALAHPEISFKYIQNNKMVFTTSGNHDLVNCVLNLYGKEVAKNTFKFYYNDNGIECVGLLGNPSLTRSNRNYEHFFINGRYIKNNLLQRAVEAAYKTLVMIGKFPFIILHLHIDPHLVDVNVHPTKMQVRFKNEELIYSTIYEGILAHLKTENLVPHVTFDKTPQRPPNSLLQPSHEQVAVDTFFAERKAHNIPTPKTMLPDKFNDDRKPTVMHAPKEVPTEEKLFGPATEPLKPSFYSETSKTLPVEPAPLKVYADEVHESQEPFVSYTIIGQLFSTYWMIQYNEKIFIMDQHAAHERVMYEKFMASFSRGEVPTQLLLLPEPIPVTAMEQMILKTHSPLFIKLGFKIEPFGENNIAIREVPFIFNQPLPASTFKEVLDTLSLNNPKDITSIKEDTIIKLSCRSAIKANDKLSHKECDHLVQELLKLENPFTCPHGRPTLVALTKSDIEKMFKRI